MRLALALALIVGCSQPPAIDAPGEWREAHLPRGVLARADVETGSVEYSTTLRLYPRAVISAVVLHEACHLRGLVLESSADCCAAEIYVAIYGVARLPEVVEFWISTGSNERAIVWMACGR